MEREMTSRLRRWILALLVFGMATTTLDLIFLNHFEDRRQLVALVALGLGLAATAGTIAWRGARSLAILRLTMLLLLVVGVAGVILHARGSMEFQLEMDPSMGRWELLQRVVRAKAPPAMAPGALVQLGLLGLIYCYRHPDGEKYPDSTPEARVGA